ncbi:phosphatidylserine decarboxylase [Oleiphilus sp. HI0009]|nr:MULTISPECIES: archaetidylserine decarboxylase [unclassified Oleiphilus]KZX82303.1 phosphatidylserine decarboxylase [Oleiphilus sp. HI0009]KZY66676.1 phosphatidylserine decarboxylase [Oleiphilus sp. HI0066]KZY73127.1 phosphatidylserine decarboxylase [Oleiphilus sp. HI0067]KZZ59475.1 phosphatidylserine decarboxylase [Oleiphilus sp. HI0125]KZZ60545.1 phosphatidylserine decarboxylase [Oleiphilus sp. HI0125]
MKSDDLFVFSQYISPQHFISRVAGKVASTTFEPVKNNFINWFVDKYDVDMSEAAEPNPTAYPSFNDFFTRALKDGARPVVEGDNILCSPVDGAISQLGEIKGGQIFQAKGQSFNVNELLGGDEKLAQPFMDGDFATIYLSPKDYHRIHMPITGTLKKMIYVPGKLFSVNPVTAQRVPNLFARNERVVAIFDTAIGPIAMVLVGAMIVASVETTWAGLVAPMRKNVVSFDYDNEEPITIEKGAEMGRFKLGSTVVFCAPPNTINFEESLKAESPVRMGETFATIK